MQALNSARRRVRPGFGEPKVPASDTGQQATALSQVVRCGSLAPAM
jgi:hypothetical protein